MICPACCEANHKLCLNLYKHDMKMKKRRFPTKTHCDCQHRESASFIPGVIPLTVKDNNGDDS